ncbi:MAG: FtsQ-type POTRA domain-containing protein [Acidobacteriota bacterium]
MREQAIGQKVGKRSGLGSHRQSIAATQRPTRRESGAELLVTRLRSILSYVPALLKLVLAIVVGIFAFAGYRAAASASFFQVHSIEVQGTSRVSADEVQSLVRKEVEKTGVWKADLKGMNARLEKLPWIRTAIVSRVLPDGIRVRITERTPRAVVRTASGRFRWVDDDAVMLGEMLPTDPMPAFFLRGLNEDDPEGARSENRERVAKFMELQRDWNAAGLSERVSEVNLSDIKDIRAQLAGDDSHIEIRLGAKDQSKRLKEGLQVLDEQKQSARGALIRYIDLGQDKRAFIGHAADVAQAANAIRESTTAATRDSGTVATAPRASVSAPGNRTTDIKTKKNRTDRSSTREKKSNETKKPDRHR